MLAAGRAADLQYELLDQAIEVSRIPLVRQLEGDEAALEVALQNIRERPGERQRPARHGRVDGA